MRSYPESFKVIIKDNLKREIAKHEQQLRLAMRVGRQELVDHHREQIELKKKKLASL